MPGFGWTPFGRRPFSVIVVLPLPAVTVVDAAVAGVVFLVEIYPTTGSPIRAATEQYTTWPTDSSPNVSFDGTVEKALRYKRSIIDGTRIGGMASGFSELVFSNLGGEYDPYADLLDGAHVIVRMVARGASYDTAIKLYDGTVEGTAQVDEESLTLHLFDDNTRLDIPAQPSVYGGTGGIDGDSNVKGKRKPLCLGVPPNVTLQLIDAVNLVYHGHDGTMGGWAHIYDRAIELLVNATADYASYAALIAGSITPSRWASCNALGIIRLGAKADGTLTGTPSGGAVSNGLVAGSPTSGTALTDTASLVHYLITISAASIIVDFGSVVATKAAQGAAIGYFVGPDDNITLRDLIDKLMYGILGWAGFRRDRTFDMGVVALPAGSPLGNYTEMDFYELKKEQLPKIMSPPPSRVFAAYSLNWTQQPDIDATVDAGTQTLRKDKFATAVSNNASLTASILAAHPQSHDSDVWPSFFVNSADAIAFCNAVLTLFGGATRGLYAVTLPADAYSLNISNPFQVTDNSLPPRFGFNTPKLLGIMSIDDDTSEEQAIVEGLG